LRQKAKAINFGLVYGMGAAGLAHAVGTNLREAEILLEKYFTTFPSIREFLTATAHEAMERGYAQTLSGRRLYLFKSGPDRAARAQAERIAKNMPIQGTSADITKIALARIHHCLASFTDAFLVNAVHDELVIECRQDDAKTVAKTVQTEMVAAAKELLPNTPVAVDIEIDTIWR
jgi:DNA polymerase I